MRTDELTSRTPTILLVEDGKGIRTLPRYLLEKQGYCVLEAGHGLEALYLARRHTSPVDILVTEPDLRFMTGTDLSRELTSQQPGMKTIFIGNQSCTRHRGSSSVCLRKAVPSATLLWTIQVLLHREICVSQRVECTQKNGTRIRLARPQASPVRTLRPLISPVLRSAIVGQ